MDGPFFLITIVAMVAAAAGAGVGATLMSLKHFPRRRGAGVSSALLGAGLPAEPQSPPQRLLALPPPRAKDPPRLDVFLISPDAPDRIVLPASPAVGRFLEIGLPLTLRWTGEDDLEDVLVRIVIPTDITFGASLDRMTRLGPPAGLIGPGIGHTITEMGAMVVVKAERLVHGAPVVLTFPVSIRQGTAGSYRIEIDVVTDRLATVTLVHTLEIAPGSGGRRPAGWTAVPDEGPRLHDPRQPIDRPASPEFRILAG